MATYVIGDIQGCYTQFQGLLTMLAYNPDKDILWSVGDLVNRGPQSLEVLRFFYQLGERGVVVLGNHDLNLLALAYGGGRQKKGDTLSSVLEAPDCEVLLDWLRQRPLLHYDMSSGYTMIHAGLPPQWDFKRAKLCAQQAEAVLQGPNCAEYLVHHMYGDTPGRWEESLTGWARIRFITNCFARLRYCSRNGALALEKKHAPAAKTATNYYPWFLFPRRASRDMRILFGHWATLGYHQAPGVHALDTGCLWGGALTAFRLEDAKVFHYPCPQFRRPRPAVRS